ncbi:MAG: hypothetical protein L0323_23070 [Planctomycetes bacterium]|nr:hypothetical protein [Planctomycetota bacterium]
MERFYAALRSQGLSLSKDTLHPMVGYLEDCFLVRTAWVEARSERRRIVNPRKAYPVDPGRIPVFDRSGRANVGHALEKAGLDHGIPIASEEKAALELLRRDRRKEHPARREPAERAGGAGCLHRPGGSRSTARGRCTRRSVSRSGTTWQSGRE